MNESAKIRFELNRYPYINQILVNQPNLRVEMNTSSIYNSFIVKGSPEPVMKWVLDKQVELFREGIEVAVFNRDDLDDGQVRVVFAARFPVELNRHR